jgi:hypothetical protein
MGAAADCGGNAHSVQAGVPAPRASRIPAPPPGLGLAVERQGALQLRQHLLLQPVAPRAGRGRGGGGDGDGRGRGARRGVGALLQGRQQVRQARG